MERLQVLDSLSIDAKSNCVGFAYWFLGISSLDEYVFPPRYIELLKDFEVADEGEVVAFVSKEKDSSHKVVWHLAPIDPDNKDFVIHRTFYGMRVERRPLSDVIRLYKKAYNVVFLQRRPK